MTSWLRVRAAIDRVVAAFVLVLSSPAVAVIALLVRRDGGPAFIKVPRVGRSGRLFGMWKLRTMRAEGADGMARGPALTIAGDDRVTPLGRRLRSVHIDELPQLVNVVTGQMLLLGPRPEAPEFVDQDDPAWREVLTVPPGIAGPTQLVVNDWERQLISTDPAGGRYRSVVVPAKLAIDRWYLRSASPTLDLAVLLALGARFLPGSRSTGLKRRVARDLPELAPVVDWSLDPSQPVPGLDDVPAGAGAPVGDEVHPGRHAGGGADTGRHRAEGTGPLGLVGHEP